MAPLLTKKTIFIISFFAACYVEAGAYCTPFKVHLAVQLPAAPQLSKMDFTSENHEKELSEKIGSVKTQNDFPRLYQNWLATHPRELTENERLEWLSCLYYYVSQDTNKNGIPDWSAINDFQPATNLFPQDPDQDGDGVLNVLDIDPLAKDLRPQPTVGIPAHLKINRPETSQLQQSLYSEFGILAIDHTDQHSPAVLAELLFLLRKGFSKHFISGLNIKYVYAFSGHDPARNIAAYHWQAQSLSLPGLKSYTKSELSPQLKMDLLSALSHEIGHAVLFDKVSTSELAEASVKFSGWTEIDKTEVKDSFFSPVFFKAYPFKQGRNFVSHYAMKNRHEWFAESFAASILNNLGQSGRLGKSWKKSLTKTAFNSSEYWVNYNSISDDFRRWFNLLLKN